MCEGFGIIVDKELTLYFTKPDKLGNCSHSDTLKRLGWVENTDPFLRNFIRAEFWDWRAGSFHFDEDETLPAWAEASTDEIYRKCIKLLEKVIPIYAEYEKVRSVAWDSYKLAQNNAFVEFNQPKPTIMAWTNYERACNDARAKYNQIRDAAYAPMVKAMSRITGYVPEGV